MWAAGIGRGSTWIVEAWVSDSASLGGPNANGAHQGCSNVGLAEPVPARGAQVDAFEEQGQRSGVDHQPVGAPRVGPLKGPGFETLHAYPPP